MTGDISVPPLHTRFGMARVRRLLNELGDRCDSEPQSEPRLRLYPPEFELEDEVQVFTDGTRQVEAGRIVVNVIPACIEITFDVWADHYRSMHSVWQKVSHALLEKKPMRSH